MRWLSGGLTFVNFATVTGLIVGILTGGLTPFCASLASIVGVIAGVIAFGRTSDSQPKREPSVTTSTPARERYRNVYKWLITACFVIFAVRSFCWLLYIDSNDLKIQSPNNLGDL